MFYFTTRTLGLSRKLYMLSIYVPFTKRETGILFALGGNMGLTVTLFNHYWYSNTI
jgi:hypothetical protein